MLPLLRYTLDLFSDALPPVKAAPPPSAQPGKAPRGVVGRGPRATAPPLSLPDPQGPERTLPLVADRLPAFTHPRANRQSSIAGVPVAYQFARARRRTIGFVVGPDGLVVRAPRWTPLYEVEAALQEKGRWVLRKLQETRELAQRRDQARIDWRPGAVFPYLGMPVVVQLDPTHQFSRSGAARWVPGPDGQDSVLWVGLPSQAEAPQIRDAVQAWLMQQARQLFLERLAHFAPRVGVQWTRLRLSSAATRWGSASADGSIRLNWRLIHFRLPVIDYVVVHELSHLRVMDHSPRFWDTVAAVVPDYADLRGQLKEDAMPRW